MCSIFYPGEIFLENASCYRVIALHTRRSVCVLPNLVLPGKPRARARAKVVISCSTFSNADHGYLTLSGIIWFRLMTRLITRLMIIFIYDSGESWWNLHPDGIDSLFYSVSLIWRQVWSILALEENEMCQCKENWTQTPAWLDDCVSNLLFIFHFQVSVEWEIQGMFVFLPVVDVIFEHTVFDLISEHALITEHPPPFFFFFFFFFLEILSSL